MAAKLLIINPFHGGSHKQLADLLQQEVPGCVTFTMTPKKWHWRARTSALYFSEAIPECDSYRVLLCTSVLNLAELIALRPDLGKLKKIVYFHENQLVYPVRKQQERDFQYGYNQIISCIVADVVVFNSIYNMESFLTNISTFLKLIPDHRPKSVQEKIRPRCVVINYPLNCPEETISDESSELHLSSRTDMRCNVVSENVISQADIAQSQECINSDEPIETSEIVEHDDTIPRPIGDFRQLHIVWPHRWEHDKDPQTFFRVLYRLHDEGLPFTLSVVGESYTDVPELFLEAQTRLDCHVYKWGYQPSKEEYYDVLQQADVAVSTATHEFFGVAMLEAVHFGCYPLCPNRLVYPEIFPDLYLYNTTNQLFKKLKNFCMKPEAARLHRIQVDTQKYHWSYLKERYLKLLAPPD